MYRQILAPLDGSEQAERVLAVTEALTHKLDLPVLIVHPRQ